MSVGWTEDVVFTGKKFKATILVFDVLMMLCPVVNENKDLVTFRCNSLFFLCRCGQQSHNFTTIKPHSSSLTIFKTFETRFPVMCIYDKENILTNEFQFRLWIQNLQLNVNAVRMTRVQWSYRTIFFNLVYVNLKPIPVYFVRIKRLPTLIGGPKRNLLYIRVRIVSLDRTQL